MAAREFYYFYQTDPKETWRVTPEGNKDKHKELGAKRMSILAVSSPEVDSSNRDNVYYKGPFYVDIDRKELSESIESARILLERLRYWGVPEESYQIFCSGSKGFHFYFHAKLFYSGRPLKHLPQIYKRMASHFYVPGLDYAPYSGGKGNLFWIPNVLREDGTYKTMISPDDLMEITPDHYRAITSVQCLREPPKIPAPLSTIPHLVAFFQEAETYVTEKYAKKAEPEEALDELSLSHISTEAPPCIGCLINGDLRVGTNFNQAAFQLATYLNDTKADSARVSALTLQLAEKQQSTKYPSTHDRARHAEGLVQYLSNTKDKPFSCQAMRAVLAFRPCNECTLEEEAEAKVDHYDIEERKDGYYIVQGKASKRLTSFIMTPIRTVFEEDPISHTMRRAYTLCDVSQMGEVWHEPVQLTEDAWLCRMNFLKAFVGISNLKITATDSEIQSLKHWVMRDTETLEDQISVSSVGIHANHIKGRTRFTYVEDGYSVNRFGVPNTHVYPAQASYNSSALPRLQAVPVPDKDRYDYEAMLSHLFKVNEPEVVAPILGWLTACHLKAQIMSIYHEFPLFVLWGGRGSGKTKTACVLTSSLHACDYLHYPPMSVGQATQFAVIDTITGTTTVPRVLDEFNRHGCRRGMYEILTDLFKAGYNNSTIGRGRLTKAGEQGRGGFGAVADYYFVTSPMMILAEHAPETPALLDRAFLSMLREPSIAGRQQHMVEVSVQQPQFWHIAKALVIHALRVAPDMLREQYEKWGPLVNELYTERQAHTRRVIGVGLQHLEQVLVRELGLDLQKEMSDLISTFKGMVGGYESVAEHAGYQTEVDRILVALAGFLTLNRRRGTTSNIPRGMLEVDPQRGMLYIDVPTAFCMLEEHYSLRRETMPIRQSQQFERILASEKYYVGTEYRENMTTLRNVVCLSLAGLKAKGIDVSLFQA